MAAYTLVAKDETGKLFSIGGFTTEARATEWWDSWYGEGGPWDLLGIACNVSGKAATESWHAAGHGIAERSTKVRAKR